MAEVNPQLSLSLSGVCDCTTAPSPFKDTTASPFLLDGCARLDTINLSGAEAYGTNRTR
jgi:hypothetical protein